MIEMQEQLEPSTTLAWKFYTPAASIDWLHTEKRELESEDQIAPSKGPRTVIPTAVFTIGTGGVAVYNWEQVGW
jgi:hypothetical protein